MHAIRVSGITKRYAAQTLALRDIGFSVEPGEMLTLLGASGSGKSTLIRILAGLAGANAGSVEFSGRILQADGNLCPDARRMRQQIGVVFQQFNLVGQISVLHNVLTGLAPRIPLARMLLRRFTREEHLTALDALVSVGLGPQAFQRASTLSGGQQQRAALARALVQGARVILADEPVASLDPESARRVMELLATLNRERGITVVMSLHQVPLARRYSTRAIGLKSGAIVYDGPTAGLTNDFLHDLYGSEADELFGGADPEATASPTPDQRFALAG
jgi:phosphonate transport system ATP-binding protein